MGYEKGRARHIVRVTRHQKRTPNEGATQPPLSYKGTQVRSQKQKREKERRKDKYGEEMKKETRRIAGIPKTGSRIGGGKRGGKQEKRIVATGNPTHPDGGNWGEWKVSIPVKKKIPTNQNPTDYRLNPTTHTPIITKGNANTAESEEMRAWRGECGGGNNVLVYQ